MNQTISLEGKLRDLSGVCSALFKTIDDEAIAHDEVMAFRAPMECLNDVMDIIVSQRERIANQWGWTLEELNVELRRRVSPRWVHFSGMGMLLANDNKKMRIVHAQSVNKNDIDDVLAAKMRKRIQQAEDTLADLEDQQAISDEPDDFTAAIRDQREYLAGLYSGMDRTLKQKGM